MTLPYVKKSKKQICRNCRRSDQHGVNAEHGKAFLLRKELQQLDRAETDDQRGQRSDDAGQDEGGFDAARKEAKKRRK